MSHRILVSPAVILLLLSASFLSAADDAGAKSAPKKNGGGAAEAPKGTGAAGQKDAGGEGGEKKETYAVVQIGNEVKVCKDSEVNALRTKVNDDYKASLKTYEDAKKAATKAKKKFTDAKPVKPELKVVMSFLKSEEDANAQRTKLVQKLEAQKKKTKDEQRTKSK